LPPSFVVHSLQIAVDMRLIHASLGCKIPAASCYLYLLPPPYRTTPGPWRPRDRNRPRHQKIADLIERYPQTFHAELLEMTDAAAIRAVVERSFAQHGRIDVLISKATGAKLPGGPIPEPAPSDYRLRGDGQRRQRGQGRP
jgi:hypothetical protein